jgi:MFS family permease
VAAGTFTAFAVGSIAAAPVAGWLADKSNPTIVAVLARVGLALTIAALAVAGGPLTIWLAAAAFGVTYALAQPAIQVILLARTPASRRRDVFAWQATAINLGLAGGAALGGWLVDLSSQTAMRPVYAIAAIAALASAAIVGISGRGAYAEMSGREVAETVSYVAVLAQRQIRWLLGIAVLITLACYAQYDSGLPAYILDATTVQPPVLGIAVAINALLVALLISPVVAFTRSRRGTSLLALCAVIWIGCWLVFGLPLLVHGYDNAFVIVGFASISFGETMMAPILSALGATLAPEGAVGRTMAAVTGATTVATAIGPILASALLGVGLPAGFIALQILFCLAAALASVRLGRMMSGRGGPAAQLIGQSQRMAATVSVS